MSIRTSLEQQIAASPHFLQLDLRPLYPTPPLLSHHLSASSTLTPDERRTLVNHSLTRACMFADMVLLTFLLYDDRCNRWLELETQDEDGNSMISSCILGFRGVEAGNDVERELEREECVRLLVKEGADLSSADHAGWTPLHHAALLAPASLISHLLSHGASPLALSRRKLTPLDVITAYEDIPGREDAITVLREATRNAMTFEERERLKSLGWRGDERREMERLRNERRERRKYRKKRIKEDVTAVLEAELSTSNWSWGDNADSSSEDELFEPSDLDDEDSDGYDSDTLLTPPDSYSTMLVFSPPALDRLFQALIPLPSTVTTPRKLRDPLPAQALYFHCRFACIACDHNWLEDLIVAGMDRIEEVVMAKPDDLASLTHWLFNTTLLLHLLRCDESTAQICEILGLFGLMEELVNVVFVLIIRIIERRLDPLIDSALLDYVPPELQEDWDAVQFEGEWDSWTGLLGRVISPKKKPAPAKTPSKMGPPSGGISTSSSAGSMAQGGVRSSTNSTRKLSTSTLQPSSSRTNGMGPPNIPNSKSTPSTLKAPSRPSSPPNQGSLSVSNSGAFASIKNTLARTAGAETPSSTAQSISGKSTPGHTPSHSASNLLSKIVKKPPGPSPSDVTTLLSALYTFMSLSGINPALIIQTFSQVLYWSSCEMFNRILQRKKYLCRGRALHIALNLGVLEEWVSGGVGVGLPREVGKHFKVVRELVTWVQCCSSIDQFASLIATVQTFRELNPLQMRRVVRDYRFEVGESHMTDECTQYLAQLQKDWERQRVKMGVEALKKEMGERESSISSRGDPANDSSPPQGHSLSASSSTDFVAQKAIDNLFSRTFEKSDWQPAKPPVVLGELLDSRYMLPLLLPSDPKHLGALPVLPRDRSGKRRSGIHGLMYLTPDIDGQDPGDSRSRSNSRAPSVAGSRAGSVASAANHGAMEWLARTRKLRVVDKGILKHLGDDEVASELETIAAKWRFAWDNTLAGAGVGDHETGELLANAIAAANLVQNDVNEDGEAMIRDGSSPAPESIHLTQEPARPLRENRRRASEMGEDVDYPDLPPSPAIPTGPPR